MPFVVVDKGRRESRSFAKIECLCKEAWVSVGGNSDIKTKESDVGGVVVGDGFLNTKIVIYFLDRGLDFRQQLYNQLKTRFHDCIVEVVPTKNWFADPVWAIVDKSDSFVVDPDLLDPSND